MQFKLNDEILRTKHWTSVSGDIENVTNLSMDYHNEISKNPTSRGQLCLS